MTEAEPSESSLYAVREERLRSQDRSRVARARTTKRPLWLMFLLVGPGILVMLGENDGPSMLSYATTGATYGVGFFVPFIVLTFAMAFVVQEMTARLGIATGRGHAELIHDRFGPFWGTFALGDLVVGNILTLITEFIAIRAGLGFFGVSAPIAVTVGVGAVLLALVGRRYFTWERVVMVLAVGNLLFIPAAFYAHPSGRALVDALGTWSPLPGGSHSQLLTLILADIGATVTPWMLFFQQSAVVDKGLTREDLPQARLDTGLGAFLAALAAIATLVAATPLFIHHIGAGSLQSPADFASALRPFIGNAGATLFALGMIEAGLVAAMTISASSSYAFGEVSRTRSSLNVGLREGFGFYATGFASLILAAGIVLIPHAPLLAMTITVNVIATLLMAPALLLLLILANDREIVGDLGNGLGANIASGTIVVGTALIGALYGVITVFPQLFPH